MAQRATTEAQLENIYRFRYEILCAIHGKAHPEADHQNRRLTDELDEYACNAFAGGSNGMHAVSRLVRATHPLAESRIRAAGGGPFLAHFGLEAVAKVGRLCQVGTASGSIGVVHTLQALMLASVQSGIRAVVCTTSPKYRVLFERMGLFYIGRHYQHAYLGEQIGMAILGRDVEHLRSIRSSLAAASATQEHLEEDARWRRDNFPMSARP